MAGVVLEVLAALTVGGVNVILWDVILWVLFIYPGVCVIGKRLHDRDKSAWWYLIVLVPLVGGIWLLVQCAFLEGTRGPNRFGSAPVKTAFG